MSAVEYFLRLGTPGQDQIVGNSSACNYVGWIELIGYSVGNTGSNATAARARQTSVLEISCTKPGSDGISAAIADAAMKGRPFSDAVIAIKSRERARNVRINMRNVVVTAFSHNPVGSVPHDNFQLYGTADIVVG